MSTSILRRLSSALAPVHAPQAKRLGCRFTHVLSRSYAAAVKKEHLNIGTIGHVDHGKTTLTAAITKFLSNKGNAKFHAYDAIDKTKEERERGITISAAHVEYTTDKRHYSHVDCPGHASYIKNMIVGASNMDGSILVVSAPDGAQTQTTEHLLLAREVGVKQVLVYLNKVDMLKGADAELIEMAEEEVRALVESYGFDAECPVIKGSARLALEEEEPSEIGSGSIAALVDAMDTYFAKPVRAVDGPFKMAIEDVFSISGRGTVVTGTIESGRVKIGQEVETVGGLGKEIKTTCIGVESFNKQVEVAEAGENIGALLRGVDRKSVGRGQVLADVGTIKASKAFEARAYVLKEDEGGRKHPIGSGYQPVFYIRTANVTGSITLKDEGTMIMPGDNAEFTVKLMNTVALAEGMRFTIREGRHTVGAGLITKIL